MLVVNRLMASINTSAKVTGGSEELLQFDFQLICMSRPEMIWRHIKGAEQRWQSYQMTRFKWEVTILLMVSPVTLKIMDKGEVSQVYLYSALKQHDLGWEWRRNFVCPFKCYFIWQKGFMSVEAGWKSSMWRERRSHGWTFTDQDTAKQFVKLKPEAC